VERTLTALLYRRDARAALAARDFAALGIAGDDEAVRAFSAIDVRELEASATLVRRALLDRRHRGTGGLCDWYPRTLLAWCRLHTDDLELDELAATFLESSAADAWREHGAGTCLEEAFYRFACAHELGDPLVREDEWLSAQLRALALCPEPAFAVPAEVRRTPAGGWFAIGGTAAAPVVHAAVGGKCIRGAITPALAAILRGEMVPSEAVRRQLVDLGLL
jgi:hypothetical protein